MNIDVFIVQTLFIINFPKVKIKRTMQESINDVKILKKVL